MMNTSGAFTGAVIHHFTKKHSALGQYLRHVRYLWFVRGRYAELGLVIIALWSLSEISPFAPSLSFEKIMIDYSHFTATIFNSEHWNLFKVIAFAFEIFALFLIAEFVLINKASSIFVFGAFAGIIIYLKLPIADTSFTAEFFWGLIVGIAFYFFTQNKTLELRTKLVMYALFLAYLISQLNHPAQITSDGFNWLPFASDSNRINRVTEILNITWIFLALSFFTLSIKQTNVKKNGLIGLVVVGIVSLTLEWQQQTLQNTSADITDVLVAMSAWALPYFHPEIRQGGRG